MCTNYLCKKDSSLIRTLLSIGTKCVWNNEVSLYNQRLCSWYIVTGGSHKHRLVYF